MANQIKGKYIKNDAIDGSKILILNNEPVRALKADGSQESLFKLNNSNELVILKMPKVTSDAADGNDLVRKSQADGLVSAEASARESADQALGIRIDAEKTRVDAILSASEADKDSFAEIVQLINSVDTANDSAFAGYVTSNNAALAAEISARQAGDAATLSSANAYADSLDDVKFYDDLASFPSNGSDGIVYLAKDSEKLYRWKSVTVPGSFDHIVGPTGSFATLQAALADSSVLDGHSIQVQAGTYSVASAINISKKVKIFGVNKDTVIFETAGAGSDPVNMFNVLVDDVVMANMTIKHKKTTNTSVEAAVNVSGSGFPQTRVANFIMDGCRIEHVEFAITIRGSNWKLANNEFAYAGPSNSTRRHVGIYGILGNCFAVSNKSFDNGATGNTRWYAITSTTGSNPNETLEGKLIVDSNVQQSGALQQFISQDAWQGSNNSFELVVRNNTTNETSAFISFFGTVANFGNILSRVIATDNSLSNLHGGTPAGGKGMIGVDGSGGVAFRSSDLPVYHSGNVLSNLTFRTDYVEATGSSGSLAGRSSGIGSASVSLSGSIPSVPSAPATPSVGPVTTSSYSEVSPADLSEVNANISSLQSSLAQEISDRQAGDSGLQSQINTEKGRIDAILSASEADKDSFAEIVSLINSVDTANDSAFAGYVISNNAALAAETSARQSADTTLQSNIDAEASARAAADTAEASARAAADTALQGDIDDLDAYAQDIRSDVDDLDGYAQDIRSDLDALQLQVNTLDANQLESRNETFTLSASDVSNGYVDLAVNAILTNSAVLFIGRLGFFEGDDFSVGAAPSGKVRVSFSAGLIASAEAPQEGDIVRVKYLVQ